MRRYIDADLLKDKTTRVNNIWNGTTNAEGKGLDEIIDDIPTADVRENVKGEWIKIHWKAFRCSECKGISEYYTDFCPNCGADMRGDKT